MITTEGEAFLLFVCPHIEVEKNRQQRHGSGRELRDEMPTERGFRQGLALAQFITQQTINYGDEHAIPPDAQSVNIRTGTQVRIEATSAYLQRAIGQMSLAVAGYAIPTELAVDPDLRGIDMGLASAMTDEEMSARFPELATGLKAWYHRATDTPPDMPGGETVAGFYGRIVRGLSRMLHSHGALSEVVVCAGSGISVIDDVLLRPEGISELAAPGSYTQSVPFVNRLHGTIESWLISDQPPVRVTDGYERPEAVEPV